MQDDPKYRDNAVHGWKALTIVLGVAALILCATWALNDRDRHSGMAQTETGTTVGLAPQH